MNNVIIFDLLEVTTITIFLYHFFVWLDKNKEKELLKPILMIIILNGAAWIYDLKAIQILFFYIATPGSIIYYLTHQESFKKNTQTHQKRAPSIYSNATYNTIELLIQEGIYGLCDNKNIVYIIEQSNSLENLIVPSLCLNTRISQEILKFFIRSTNENKTCNFLIKNNDIVGTRIPLFDDFNLCTTQNTIQTSLQEHIIDTDAIVVLGFYTTHTWAIFHKEYGYFDLTTKELFTILNHFLNSGDTNQYDHTKNSKASISQHSL